MTPSFSWLSSAGASILLAWSAAAFAAEPIAPACGDTIGPGGSYVLSADVGPCGVSVDPALTVVGPVTVDFGGHAVSCDGDDGLPPGIVVLGGSAVLSNGSVRGCADAVGVTGDGHRVERMTIDGYGDAARTGLAVHGHGNTLARNRLRTCPKLDEFDARAISVAGNGNVLRRNVVRQNGCGSGFQITGDDNLLVGNNLDFVQDDGYGIRGDGNVLRRNVVRGASYFPVFVDGAENEILRNVVRSSNNRPSYAIQGTKNQVRRNTALRSGWAAFSIQGDEHVVEDNVAVTGHENGFSLGGTGTRLAGNVAIDNPEGGFFIGGSGHTVTLNTSIRSGDGGPFGVGLTITGTDHQVTHNQALENRGDGIRVRDGASNVHLEANFGFGNEGFDLADENAGCGTNAWTFNDYETRNQACVQ